MAEAATAPVATEPVKATIDSPAASEKAPQEYMADIMGDFESMSAGKEPAKVEKPKPAKPSAKQPEKPIREQPKPKEVEAPKEEKAPEKPVEAPEEKPAEVKPVKAAELRAAYDGLKKKVREELEPEVQRLRSKVKEYESKKPEDSAPAISKIKELEQRNEELEKRIQFVDYTNSKEFTEKYDQPYREAWTEAVSEFRELSVREPDGTDDMGEPKYKLRPADENDLIRLGSMRLSDMDDAAAKMFGPSAARATTHIQNLRRLIQAKNKAVSEAQTRAQQKRQEEALEAQTRSQTIASTWQEINKGLKEKYPKAFEPEEGDDDDKASHAKGFALADLMFTGENSLTPEQVEALPAVFKDTVKAKQPLSESQRVQLHAIARLKMANHDRKVVALKKANDRISELEKALAEYEKSEPSAEKAGESGDKPVSKDWLESAEDELRALDK